MSDNLIEMNRGDSRTIPVSVTRDNDAEDLTGATLWFTAKRNKADPYSAALIKKSSGATGGVSIVSALAGFVEIPILPADTSGFGKAEKLYCDVQLLTGPNSAVGAGKVETITELELSVSLDVTDTLVP